MQRAVCLQKKAADYGAPTAATQLHRLQSSPPPDSSMPATDIKLRPSAAARTQQVLHELLTLLDEEYDSVYGHNLGVASGSAVLDDLVAARCKALCRRCTAMIAHEEACAQALLAVCKTLPALKLNRLLTVLDAFGLEQVTDWLRLSFTDSSALEPISGRTILPSEVDNTSHIGSGTTTQKSAHQGEGSPGQDVQTWLGRQNMVAHDHGHKQPKTLTQLRSAGHPLVQIADGMLAVRSPTHHTDDDYKYDRLCLV